MFLSDSTVEKLKNAIAKADFSVDYAIISKLELPYYLYIKNIKTSKHIFIEINEKYVTENFENPENVTKGEIHLKLKNEGCRIVYEAYRKIDIFKRLKRRHKELLDFKDELDTLKTLFNDNPEYFV